LVQFGAGNDKFLPFFKLVRGKAPYLSPQTEFQKLINIFARAKAVCMQNFNSRASKLRVEFMAKKFILLVQGSAFFNVQKMHILLFTII